jgi:hypothetical protein
MGKYGHMFYGKIRSYTERIWHLYGRIRHRIRSFTTVNRVRNRRPGYSVLAEDEDAATKRNHFRKRK